MIVPMGRECFEMHPFRDDLLEDPRPAPDGSAFYRVKSDSTVLVVPRFHAITGKFEKWVAFGVDLYD